ncbi:MAG: RsmE family RNA methyltransferase [Acidobacteriota bacterium]
MARRRFFVDAVHHGRALLAGDEVHHLRKVLRAERGQRFELSDNHSVYLAEIEDFGKDQVVFRVLDKLPAEEPPRRVTLYAALFKFDRFEWLVEKATELGAGRIVPVAAERTEKGLDQAAVKRLERWRRIAREASQQAHRARLPEIAPPIPFAEALADPSAHRLFLDKTGTVTHFPVSAVALLVGPEGGWTDAERAAALAAGWTAVSLGPLILRAETAAIAALAVVVSR